jgi:hypothetical protein
MKRRLKALPSGAAPMLMTVLMYVNDRSFFDETPQDKVVTVMLGY